MRHQRSARALKEISLSNVGSDCCYSITLLPIDASFVETAVCVL